MRMACGRVRVHVRVRVRVCCACAARARARLLSVRMRVCCACVFLSPSFCMCMCMDAHVWCDVVWNVCARMGEDAWLRPSSAPALSCGDRILYPILVWQPFLSTPASNGLPWVRACGMARARDQGRPGPRRGRGRARSLPLLDAATAQGPPLRRIVGGEVRSSAPSGGGALLISEGRVVPT